MTTTADTNGAPVVTTRSAESDKRSLRARLMAGIAGAVLLAAAGYGAWYAVIGSAHVTTDNAYVGADSAQVTPLVGGPVKAVNVSDTQAVTRGDILVELDDADARITLAQAEADLDQARRRFEQTTATNTALSGQMAARAADVDRAKAQLAVAQSNFDKARIDLERRQALAKGGAVSGDELTTATNAFAAAQANLALARAGVTQADAALDAARGELAANAALIHGSTIETDPAVAAAQARLDQARLDLERTRIRAPIDGIVTSRRVQVGQRVAAGTPVMTVVPVDQLYVDANYKEGQLTEVKIGQPVELVSDLYGGDVVFHGKVVGLAGGTGAAFALIPAQNATGNWIKVVQRLPVRIALDPQELKAHPLRVGLSMEADIDVRAGK
ncbi:HlyD family efflux transporter periplasmic adaptor subunit [Oleisolibacter albus]|uniref:HlyD family secretion protein n=1 Tax=Oleisolibacter albus TaxID=2171757 RepID=UPI000DF3B018|nr:HlyD family efflux transporter periplasmic adaptor subunit [Oleisolibacter albus]